MGHFPVYDPFQQVLWDAGKHVAGCGRNPWFHGDCPEQLRKGRPRVLSAHRAEREPG